jgi:hypothetical protein
VALSAAICRGPIEAASIKSWSLRLGAHLAQLREAGFSVRVYRHKDSVEHPRPLHLAWNGLALPPDHAFWRAHLPPGVGAARVTWSEPARIRVPSASGASPTKPLPAASTRMRSATSRAEHGNPATEAPRGQRPVTAADYARSVARRARCRRGRGSVMAGEATAGAVAQADGRRGMGADAGGAFRAQDAGAGIAVYLDEAPIYMTRPCPRPQRFGV